VVGLVDADLAADRGVEALDRGDVARAEPQVVQRAGLAGAAVVDGLDAVAARVAQERAVVVVVVLGAQPGCAVVGVAGRDPDAVELVDELP
jgi:hypothetical protein